MRAVGSDQKYKTENFSLGHGDKCSGNYFPWTTDDMFALYFPPSLPFSSAVRSNHLGLCTQAIVRIPASSAIKRHEASSSLHVSCGELWCSTCTVPSLFLTEVVLSFWRLFYYSKQVGQLICISPRISFYIVWSESNPDHGCNPILNLTKNTQTQIESWIYTSQY